MNGTIIINRYFKSLAQGDLLKPISQLQNIKITNSNIIVNYIHNLYLINRTPDLNS